MGSKKSIQPLGINPGPTASGPTDCLSHTTVTHIQRAYFGPMQVPLLPVQPIPLDQVSCLCGYPHHGLDPFVHILPLPLFEWTLGAQTSA